MKAYSGIIVTRSDEPDDGRAFIKFNEEDWPDWGEAVYSELDPSDARAEVVGRFGQPHQAGGEGDFSQTPAYQVHIREFKLEDKGRGRSEIDNWLLNSNVETDHVSMRWQTPERRSKVEEIGFIVIGE